MYPNPNQYPLQQQQQAYKPVQEYPVPGQESGVVGKPEVHQHGYMSQAPVNTSFPVDSKQGYSYPTPAVPQGQYYSYPYASQGFSEQQEPNSSNPQIMPALNYLQNPTVQPTASGTVPPQVYNMPFNASAFGQGQQSYSAYGGYPSTVAGQNEQGNKSFGGFQGNKYRNEGGFRNNDRGDRGDRGERGDRGYKNERSHRDFRDERGNRDDRDRDRDRHRDRGDRGDRNDRRGGRDDRGERSERKFDNYESKDRRSDNYQRDRTSSRRSRSNSREFEKKDTYSRKPGYNSYNKDREGGDRHGNRDNFNKSNPRYPPRGDFNDRKFENGNDWKCIECGNVNWAKRDECNRCHVKKPENAPVVPRDSNTRSNNSYPSRGGFNPRSHHSMNNYKKDEFKGSNYRNHPESQPQPQTDREV